MTLVSVVAATVAIIDQLTMQQQYCSKLLQVIRTVIHVRT